MLSQEGATARGGGGMREDPPRARQVGSLPSCWDPHTRKEELNTALKISSFFLIEKEKLKKYRKIKGK